VLRLAEATVVAAHEDLHLLAPAPVPAEDVQVGISSDAVEGGFKLLAVADGTARTQVQRNRPGDRNAAANRRVDRGINRRGPSAAGKAGHVKGAVGWEVIGSAAALEVIQAQGCGFEEILDRAAGGGELEHGLMAAGAIPR